MELRLLRHFVAVADQLHFRGAAETLGVPQPVLSRSVAALESELETRLFERTRRQVRLTPAGSALLVEARALLAGASAARERVRRLARPDKTLRIGHVPSAAFGLLPEAIRRAQAIDPEINVKLAERAPADALEQVGSGQLDLALVHERPAFLPRVRCETLVRLPIDAVAPAGWDWDVARPSRLRDFAERPFVLPDPASNLYSSRLISACRSAGFEPRLAATEAATLSLLVMVAAGIGMTFAHRLVRSIRLPGLTFIELDDLPDDMDAALTAAWPSRTPTASERIFAECIRSAAAEVSSGSGLVAAGTSVVEEAG